MSFFNPKRLLAYFLGKSRLCSAEGSLDKLMEILDYRFRDQDLLQRALTHRSIIQEEGVTYFQANEMLEFLGDAVLGFIVVEHLYRSYPAKREGDLSKIKSLVVSGESLQKVARNLNLGIYILMSQNEAHNGGRNRGSILENALEALVAALYLDGGIEVASRFINKWIIYNINELADDKQDFNYKSQLLEHAQGIGLSSPMYKVISEDGPDHKKQFEVEVLVDNEVHGVGTGNTKKAAQQQAAQAAIEKLTINVDDRVSH